MNEDLILLNPGPACTSQRVKNAMLRGDLCHREPEFSELLTRLRSTLPGALCLPRHEALLITGSGTSAMEMAIISAVQESRAVLVVNNGIYGERLLAIARAHGITAYEVQPGGDSLARWTTPADPQAVARALAQHPDVDTVACVHHETTTGLINPIREIGGLLRGTDRVFVVDAISSTGNEDADLGEACLDLVCGTANKGLHGQPGVSFLLCSPKGVARLQQVPTRSLYLSAATYLASQRKGDVPFTPAVPACYALDEALQEYAEQGGFAGRTRLYRERATMVRAGIVKAGLETLVAPPARSNSVTTLHLPRSVPYDALHDQLKRRGYVIYACQGQLAGKFFRIATMGEIPWPRLAALEDALAQSIAAARHP